MRLYDSEESVVAINKFGAVGLSDPPPRSAPYCGGFYRLVGCCSCCSLRG